MARRIVAAPIALVAAIALALSTSDARADGIDSATRFFPTLRFGGGVSAGGGVSNRGLADATVGLGYAVATWGRFDDLGDARFVFLRLEGGYHYAGVRPNQIETWSVGAAAQVRYGYVDAGMVLRFDAGWVGGVGAAGYYVGARAAFGEGIVGFEAGFQSLGVASGRTENWQAIVFLDAGFLLRLVTILASIPVG